MPRQKASVNEIPKPINTLRTLITIFLSCSPDFTMPIAEFKTFSGLGSTYAFQICKEHKQYHINIITTIAMKGLRIFFIIINLHSDITRVKIISTCSTLLGEHPFKITYFA
jgi:hypothetical protein